LYHHMKKQEHLFGDNINDMSSSIREKDYNVEISDPLIDQFNHDFDKHDHVEHYLIGTLIDRREKSVSALSEEASDKMDCRAVKLEPIESARPSIDTADNSFICQVCSKGFRTLKLLRSHMEIHKDVRRCPICIPVKFFKPYVLKKHLKIVHKKVKDIPCEFNGCDKMFKQKLVMKTHMKVVHYGERALCNICGKAVRNMHYHRLNCNRDNVNRIVCELCEKPFSCKTALELHVNGVHANIKEVCPVCGKEVRFVNSHMRFAHSEEKLNKFACNIPGCDKTFITKQNVAKHIERVHDGKKDQCTICKEWLKNLPSHMYQVHKQGKEHVCDDCGKVFYRSYDLKLHIQRVHMGIRFTCNECGKSVSKINEHLKVVHGVTM